MGIGISFVGKKKGGFLSKKIKADELITSGPGFHKIVADFIYG
jgi:hypothetical protein